MEPTETITKPLEISDLNPERSAKLVNETRAAVRAEFQRAANISTELGGSTPEVVELQISHTETVLSLSRLGVAALEESGQPLNDSSKTYVDLLALLHDVAKIASERKREDRLLYHGWDSAHWAQNWLHKQGFSTAVSNLAYTDLQSHMGMPFVERAKSASPAREDIPPWTDPQSVEAAVLFSADLLSPMIFAGPDTNHQTAGCFDRYFNINLGFDTVRKSPNPAKAAFDSAKTSLVDNVNRLIHPPDAEKPERAAAAAAEQTIGRTLGNLAVSKLASLESFIETEIGWENMTKRNPDFSVDIKATQAAYYQAVFSWRETSDLDFSKLENQ
jgi:hypothetical protein